MLNAIYKLGKLYVEKEKIDETSILLTNKKIGAVLLVELTKTNTGDYNYTKSFQVEYDSQDNVKYLYKRGSSNGPDITPSCLITDLENKTYPKKFIKWFEKNQTQNELFKKLYDAIIFSKETIFNDLKKLLEEINIKGKNIMLSLVLKTNDGKYYYLNDVKEFKEILLSNSLEKYQGNKKIKGQGVCYLCNNEKEVYGLVSNSIGFGFSTPEKVGNTPNCSIKEQWKLIPICSDCALHLQAGKKFIEEYLNFKEYGLNYLVIPNFIFQEKEGFNKIYNALKLLKKEDEQLNSKDITKLETRLKRIVNKLDDLIELRFIFYEKPQVSVFNILSYIESGIPSYINSIYEKQCRILDTPLFKETKLKTIYGPNHTGDFLNIINHFDEKNPCTPDNWYFKILKEFTPDFKTYLNIITNTLNQNKIEYNVLLNYIMIQIRKDWRNNKDFEVKTKMLKALLIIHLLNELKILKGSGKMNTNDEINEFLDTPSKKAIFILGALSKKIMNIQYVNGLVNKPFYEKLWGLNLDQKKIMKLVQMVINKLEEYNYFNPDIQDELSTNLIKAGENWNMSKDEISFYFVLGFIQPDYINNFKKGSY